MLEDYCNVTDHKSKSSFHGRLCKQDTRGIVWVYLNAKPIKKTWISVIKLSGNNIILKIGHNLTRHSYCISFRKLAFWHLKITSKLSMAHSANMPERMTPTATELQQPRRPSSDIFHVLRSEYIAFPAGALWSTLWLRSGKLVQAFHLLDIEDDIFSKSYVFYKLFSLLKISLDRLGCSI